MNRQPNTPASLNEAVAGGTPGPWSVSADGRDVITDYRDALGNKTPDNWTKGGYAKVIARLEVTAWRNELQRKADAKRIASLAAPAAAIDAREQEADTGDSLYVAGMRAGWNYAISENGTGFEAHVERLRRDSLASRQEAPTANGEALSDALNEFVPEWDDKAHEIRKLRAKIKRITDALATPSEALPSATVAQPNYEALEREHMGDPDKRTGIYSPRNRLGSWLSAALEDPAVCEEMKSDIRDWFAQPCASQGCAGAYRVFMDGNQWCAVGPGFTDLQQSLAGFSDTPYRALELLRESEAEEKRRANRAALSTDKSGGADHA